MRSTAIPYTVTTTARSSRSRSGCPSYPPQSSSSQMNSVADARGRYLGFGEGGGPWPNLEIDPFASDVDPPSFLSFCVRWISERWPSGNINVPGYSERSAPFECPSRRWACLNIKAKKNKYATSLSTQYDHSRDIIIAAQKRVPRSYTQSPRSASARPFLTCDCRPPSPRRFRRANSSADPRSASPPVRSGRPAPHPAGAWKRGWPVGSGIIGIYN